MSELPIHDAAIDGDFTELLEALDDGFDVNAVDVEHETALHYAAYEGFEEGVKLLLERGANALLPNKKKALPIHHAARRGFDKIVRMLLRATGPAVKDVQDIDGDTPCHLACMGGHLKCAFLLVSKNTNTIVNENGQTAFSFFNASWITPADQQRLLDLATTNTEEPTPEKKRHGDNEEHKEEN